MLKRLFFILLLSGVALEGATLADRSSFIESAVEKVIAGVAPAAHVGLEVVSLGKGDHVYGRNGEKRYMPGSSLKLFIAGAALDLLGPHYRFETGIYTDGKDCYLVASGDPSLDAKGLEDLVHQMKQKGVDRIEGNVVLDLEVFDRVEMGPGWMWDEEPAFWCSPLGALNVEHNCMTFSVQPSSEAGRSCYVSFYPECEGIELINRTKTFKKGQGINVRRLVDGRFELAGSMGVEEESWAVKVPVREPHKFAAAILRELFRKNQIAFDGDVTLGECPKDVMELGMHRSEVLSELLKTLLKESDNLYADTLFKKVGQVRFGAPGTWQKGSRAVREFLAQKVGMDVEEMVVLDGCGLSRYNLVSPRQMVAFLRWVHEGFVYGAVFKEALPIAGIDGTLKGRMKAPFLQGKVRAKTGSMTGVSALCGYVEGEEDGMVFALFANGYVKSGREIKGKLEDEVCHVLVNAGFSPK